MCITAIVPYIHSPHSIKINLSNYFKYKQNSCIAEQKFNALISLSFKLILLSMNFLIDDF